MTAEDENLVSDGEEKNSDSDEYESMDDDNSVHEDSLDGDKSDHDADISHEDADHSDEGEDSDKEGDEDADEGNTGWADAVAKVLAMGKNSEKKVSILSKAKKDNVKVKKKAKIKEETGGENEESSDDEPVLEPLAVRKARKKELDSIGRSKPDILQKNYEKTLTKIATRGVVQLFNAVREQQKDLKSKLREAGASTRKREKVFKNIDKSSFVELLTGTKTKSLENMGPPPSKKSKDEVKEEIGENGNSASWNILREDYMLDAKMRDWDKDSDED